MRIPDSVLYTTRVSLARNLRDPRSNFLSCCQLSGAIATGEWYVTSYNLGATMMIVTAVSKIYDDRHIALFRSNYHCLGEAH
ncbi:hypothetical protein QUA30_11710 [Microcoleus sp. Pol14C2]|uniref:hypothetical protein n=1 Tax=unclassified Microcoleus TaxID=2642155 RepID=UPI002FD6150C